MIMNKDKETSYASQKPAATAAALPPELPPAERGSLEHPEGWCGLTTAPCTECIFKELRTT